MDFILDLLTDNAAFLADLGAVLLSGGTLAATVHAGRAHAPRTQFAAGSPGHAQLACAFWILGPAFLLSRPPAARNARPWVAPAVVAALLGWAALCSYLMMMGPAPAAQPAVGPETYGPPAPPHRDQASRWAELQELAAGEETSSDEGGNEAPPPPLGPRISPGLPGELAGQVHTFDKGCTLEGGMTSCVLVQPRELSGPMSQAVAGRENGRAGRSKKRRSG